MEDLKESVRKSSYWVLFRFLISISVGTFITTFVVRTLSIRDYGIYNVLYSLIAFVSVIASFGIPQVFQRFLPEAYQKKDFYQIKKIISFGLLIRFFLSFLTILLVFLFNKPIGNFLKIDGLLKYFTVFAWGIIFCLEITLFTQALHSLFLHKYSVIASTFYTLIRGICIFFALKSGMGLIGVLWSEVIAWAFQLILSLWFYKNKFSQKIKIESKPPIPIKRFFRYAGFSSLNELGSSVLGVSTDFFVITATLGPTYVSFYAFADRIIRLFQNCMPHNILIDVIRPTFFSKYSHSKNKNDLNHMFNIILKISAFFIFPLAMALLVIGDKVIIYVFSAKYIGALTILWIIIISNVLNIFVYPTGLVLQALEKVNINFYSKIFAVYNLVVEIIIIKYFQVIGVVVVTCTAVLFKNIYMYYYARKFGQVKIDFKGLGKILFNSILMGVILFPLRMTVSNLLSLLFISVIGFTIFIIVSFLNKGFCERERTVINSLLPAKLFYF